MRYSIVYSTRTGNTKLLAETVRTALPEDSCVYCGEPDARALDADRVYVGFWTDRGSCNQETAEFLKTLDQQEVFLFGSAGFGASSEYFDAVLERTSANLKDGGKVVGTFMCQGRMPLSVRERYMKMKEAAMPVPNLDRMIENFDTALSHPNDDDLAHLKSAVLAR